MTQRNSVKLLLLTLLLPVFSMAGITSVGKGGGLAELQFIHYFNNTAQVIDLCLYTKKCALENEELNYLLELKQKNKSFENQYNIIFNSQINKPWILKNHDLLVSMPWLYKNQVTPKSEQEIISAALSIQIAILHPELDFNQLLPKIINGLKELYFYKQTTTLQLSGKNFVSLHRIANDSQSLNLALVALEDDRASYSLNQIIQKKYPELNLADSILNDVNYFLNGHQIIFYGFIGSRAFKIQAQLDTKNEFIDPNTIDFFISIE